MKLESLIWGDKIKELQLKQNLHSGITIFLWCVCKKKKTHSVHNKQIWCS